MRILRGIKAFFRFMRSGCERVVEDERIRRLSTCHYCEELRDRGSFETCNECGCYVRLKTWCASEDCPHNYWPKRPAWRKQMRARRL